MMAGPHMKTNVQPTSLEAYHEKVLLPECQEQVLDVFFENPGRDFTNQEIAKALGWEICSITGRTFELRGKNLFEESRKRTCTVIGSRVLAWRMAR